MEKINRSEDEITQAVQNIIAKWFYTMPIFFKIACKNPVVANKKIACKMRSGKNRVEYNPNLLSEDSNKEIRKMLSIEFSRILLGHCTKRRPEPFDAALAILASNITITQKIGKRLELPLGENFEFYYKELLKIKNQKKDEEDKNDKNPQNNNGNGIKQGIALDSSDSKENSNPKDDNNKKEDENNSNKNDLKNTQTEKEQNPQINDNENESELKNENEKDINSNASNLQESSCSPSSYLSSLSQMQEYEDATELWNNGDLLEELEKKKEIEEILENVDEKTFSLLPGNIAGNLTYVLKIEKSHVPDRIKVAKLFMQKINFGFSGGKHYLTRMRPSRRMGFLQMGTRYTGKIKLFCVLDVSGSVSDYWISKYTEFLNFIKRKYHCEIDIVQADTELKSGRLIKMKSTIQSLKVEGRGGTDFQCVIDYLNKHRNERDFYSGTIIFTDGYVLKPKIPENLNVKILWAINTKKDYERIKTTFSDKKNLVTFLEDK